jgi:hypothetical protein
MTTPCCLFLDDERDPPDDGQDWVIARSSKEAMVLCRGGAPSFISFDHDLGDGDDAMVFAHWLVESDLDLPGFLPAGFSFFVHSQNPVGAANLKGLLERYLEKRDTLHVSHKRGP